MTQLYVGNLSAEADDKVVRAIFGKYGTVRETILKNGYAFVEYENPSHAEAATKDLNSKSAQKLAPIGTTSLVVYSISITRTHFTATAELESQAKH